MSAAARPGVPRVERDVEYAHRFGQSLTLDIYRAPGGGVARPAVIAVHGGRWSQLDKRLLAGECAYLAIEGFVAFAVNYRMLNGMLALPSQIDNLRAAIRFVRANAARFGADPARISLFGGSAGGQLSALAALDPDPEQPEGRVRAAAIWSGFFDLAGVVERNRARGGAEPPALEIAIGGPPAEFPDRYRRFSPISHVRPGAPPMFVAVSTNETSPLADSEAFVAALAAAGITHEFVVYEGNAHMREYSPVAMAPTAAFLKRHG